MPLDRPGLFAALSGVTFLDLPPPDNPGSSEASWSGARRMRLTRDGPEVLIALRPGAGREGQRGVSALLTVLQRERCSACWTGGTGLG